MYWFRYILREPAARNTAACIGYAAFEIIKKYGDGVMCIFPSDHSYPCTGYGYIRFDKSEAGIAKKVIEFKEKPDLATAEKYVASGEYAWNSGMFVWKASVILEQFKEFLPDVYECLAKIGDAMGTDSEMDTINEVYPVIPSISIDYGIMEKSDIVKVISADMGWSDVGNWDNLGVLHDTDDNGNIVAGNHLAIDTKDCITYSKKRLITTIGVENLIIVETEDAILVCDKNRAQDVKMIVDKLKEDGREELL